MKSDTGHHRFGFRLINGAIATVFAWGLGGCVQPNPQAPKPQSTVKVLSRSGTKEVPSPPKLEVRQVAGRARYSVRDYPAVTLKPNMTLPEESQVTTAAEGMVDVLLPECHLALRIMPQSRVLVERVDTHSETRPRLHLQLLQGRMVVVVQDAYRPGQLEVGTDFGRAGVIEAGNYDFYSDGRIIVGEGAGRAAIVFSGLTQEKIPYVHAGQMFSPSTRTTGTTPPPQSADSQEQFRRLAQALGPS